MYKIEDIKNKIICGDCLEVMKDIPDKSVDLVLTDPPYNYNKNFANDNLLKNEYLKFSKCWLKEVIRTLRENGSMYIILGHSIIANFKMILDDLGMVYRNWITWVFRHGMGGCKNYSYRHEDMLFYSKPVCLDIFKKYFNSLRKQQKLNLKDINYKLNVAVSGGGCASSWLGNKKSNTLPTPKQYKRLKEILDADNRFDNWFCEKRKGFIFNLDDIAVEPIRKDKRIREAGKNPSNVWYFDVDVWNSPNRINHPTPKPLGLMERIIKASSNEGDLILDPFLGSGTTAVACKRLKRNYIGIEINPEYVKMAEARVRATPKPLF